MDYHQMGMDLLCGVLDALPQPTALLNLNGQAAYVNPLGEELSVPLSRVNFEENNVIVAALVEGTRCNGEAMTLTADGVSLKGFASVYPVLQNDEVAGALLSFRPLEQESADYPSALPYASEDMEEILGRVARFSGINASVMFLGEPGVGKESFARLLHSQSHNSHLPFAAADCRPGSGGLTALLSDDARCAEFAAAGTLFFDNVQALRPPEQASMLELIHSKRLGRHEITARLCYSATPDINALAETGEFSSELKTRVSLMGVSIPPLRERSDDIPPLAKYFLSKYAAVYEKKICDFSEEVWRYFLKHDWPRNLQDMEVIIKESAAECTGSVITDIPLSASRQVSLRRARHKFTYTRIEALLSVYGSTTEGKRRAAKELGIGLSSLYRIIANYNHNKKWGRVD